MRASHETCVCVCAQVDRRAGGAASENEEKDICFGSNPRLFSLSFKMQLMELPAHYSLRGCARALFEPR